MRELVAPATRWLLRLALFLALMAWLQGQWWRVIAQWAPVGMALTHDGYAIVFGNGGMTGFEIHSVDDQPRLNEFYIYPSTLLGNLEPTGFQFAGIAVNNFRSQIVLVGIRHVTVVGIILVILAAFEITRQRMQKRLAARDGSALRK